MHFTRSRHVRTAVELGELRGEAAAKALDGLLYAEPLGLGLENFDARAWRDLLGSAEPDDAAQDMLDMMLDDSSLRKGEYVLGPRALAAGAARIVASLRPFDRIRTDRRYLSRAQAEALAAAVLRELGVSHLVGRRARARLLGLGPAAAAAAMEAAAGAGPAYTAAESGDRAADAAAAQALRSGDGLHSDESGTPTTAASAAAASAAAASAAAAASGPTFSLVPSVLATHQPMPLPIRAFLAGLTASARTAAAALGFREARVTTSWGRWHFFVAGPTPPAETAAELPAEPPIVVVHGLFTTSSSMLALASALSTALPHRTVILPDLMGFDFSLSRTSRERHLPSWADQVAALTEALRQLHRAGYRSSQLAPDELVPPATVAAANSAGGSAGKRARTRRAAGGGCCFDWVGHSFGGWVSEQAAELYPDMVRRLVLLCPGGHGRYRRYRSEVLVTGGGEPMRALFRRLMPSVAAPLAAQAMLGVAQSSGVIRQLVSMGSSDFFERPSAPLKTETLLLWGSHDDLHSPFWGLHCDGLPPSLPQGRGPSPPGADRRDAAAVPAPGLPGSAAARTAGAAAAGAASSGQSLPAPRHMLQDLTRARGFWLERSNHAINVDSAHTVAVLAARFFTGGLEALPDAPSALRMTADVPLVGACAGLERRREPAFDQPVGGPTLVARALAEALRLGTSVVFRSMKEEPVTGSTVGDAARAAAESGAQSRPAKL
ncbi:hypothetical protein FNF31_04184 [Cafeteria roenbergensis]|uniref:Uncharacterized protein n=1 Tax=Cafeteria roenbergensis TaxID=33653 RepID=A0A5A8D566_CAFRO|nr:hypothetical protein FNF28_05461 [Cafeteria roenbergensis]KAA0160633.1 hypothetical protein FNF31_04184 [Cafeteria roenbergensis]